jgi:predicted RNA-binding protein Jag
MLEEIQNLTLTFFEKLGADFSDLQTVEEAKNIYRISVKSDDSHLLIGPHGKNLEIITHLLKLLIAKKSQGHINIHVEVNDYLQQKDAKLLLFIQWKIDQVKSSGKEVILPLFTAYERKKVHSFVWEKWWNVFTESKWEGSERRIHLCKKDEKMTIDINGDDI